MIQNKLIKVEYALTLMFSILLLSCSKFLDKKPAANLAVIRTLDDMQALLDYHQRMNSSLTGLGEASADNYYLPLSTFNSQNESNRNIYLWEEDIYAGTVISQNPWATINNPIYHANLVLDAVDDVPVLAKDEDQRRYLIGAAHFFRARSWHVMATTWAPIYQKSLATTQLGIPIRLSPDFNEVTTRATVEETYNHIIEALEAAIRFLPVNVPHMMRPSKPAAYGLMSRVYLSMGEFEKAWKYADSSLRLNSYLLDYNELSSNATFPIPQFNNEILFNAVSTVAAVNTNNAVIDTLLYAQYGDDDLRKLIYFQSNGNGTFRFKGNYFNSTSLFTGLTVAEVYLNYAEGLVRSGDFVTGLEGLNTLLKKRWRAGEFIDFQATSQTEALRIVLDERRKELVMRDLRWMDLKRLNLEDETKTTVKRVIDGVEYILPPNDLRYNLQFPMLVIDLSGIQPNPR